MKDIEKFQALYQQQLNSAMEEMPQELLDTFTLESCIRKDKDQKKALYTLIRKKDGVKALLRVTKNYPAEDALEEGKLLEKLDHPAIPKAYAFFSKEDSNYLIREYFTGYTLYDMVKMKGPLSAGDIYTVVLELCKVLD
ncbi:MAG: protein kinase, partial [Clostridiales bacterium]|nr:protein kinase [Clostridiales bacterium]